MLNSQGEQTKDDRRRAARRSIASAFIEIDPLSDTRDAEEKEDYKCKDCGVHHRVHRHGSPAQCT